MEYSPNDFDQKAGEWDLDPVRIERAAAVAKGMQAAVNLSPEMEAFEYGCGTGLLSFALYRYLKRITLADNSPGMLQVLQEKIAAARIESLHPVRLNLEVDPLPDERYDLIYTLMTLHHIEKVDRILVCFVQMIKPHGILCIADLDKEDGNFHGPEFHGHYGFERAMFKKQVERVGLTVQNISTVYQHPRQVGEEAREYPVFLLVATKDLLS